ncbi:MAG: excinuclease ABC subunit UvrC [bacterium]
MTLEDVKKLNIPVRPGSYQYYDDKGAIIYVGKAANLKSRVLSYWQKSTTHSPMKAAMMKAIVKIMWIETDSEIEALLLESNLIKKYQPYYNILMRDDKRYAYIKISLEDEIPGVFIVRNLDKSGKYFGPFTNTTALNETLKVIRKIWPYCTERKQKAKPCFYSQVGRCLGICGGLIERREYLERVIRPIVLFFEGRKAQIVKDNETRIKKLNKQIEKEEDEAISEKLNEELRHAKYTLLNMRNVLEHANVLGLIDKYATDVVELAKVLGLTKTPQRIEGYDISNNFGKEAVGSMVVFREGEPDKNEYRKFKIKSVELSNLKIMRRDVKRGDTQMLQEVMSRRLTNDWPLPDLIIIDGGKGQVSAVASILKKAKLDIQIIGISKGDGLRSGIAPDKLFFPGEKKPLQLPLSSPALHLIKRVRDEAHRFAITYHRNLRSRDWLEK